MGLYLRKNGRYYINGYHPNQCKYPIITYTRPAWAVHNRPVLNILREGPLPLYSRALMLHDYGNMAPPRLIRGQETIAIFVDRILAPILSFHFKHSLLMVIPAPPYHDDMGIEGWCPNLQLTRINC